MQMNYKNNNLVRRKIKNIRYYLDINSSSDLYISSKYEISEINLNKLYEKIYSIDKKYRILHATIEILNYCNFNCGFCYINNKKNIKFTSFNTLKLIFDTLINQGLIHCTLTGGEVFLHPEFLSIYLYLKHKGVLVSVYTNLSMLNDKIKKIFIKYKPFNVDVTLYGFSSQIFSKTIISDSIDVNTIYNNVLWLKENNINITCKMTITKDNNIEFLQIKKWCENNNINFRYTSELVNSSINENVDKYKVNINYKKNNIKVQNNKFFNCPAGKYAAFIDYNLKMMPCWKFYSIPELKVPIYKNKMNLSIKILKNKIKYYKNTTVYKIKENKNLNFENFCVADFIKNVNK